MLRIAICDDDQLICGEIERTIEKHGQQNYIKVEVDVFFSGEKLIDFIQNNHSFDLLFLDIELITTTGVEVGKYIRNEMEDYISKIVFISSKTGYEMELFQVQPLNFLKKPIKEVDVFDCLELAYKILEKENKYFEYYSKQVIKKIKYKEILYFESKLKKIRMVTLTGEDIFVGGFEKMLAELPATFIRTHGSYVVNYHNIKCITREDVIMVDGSRVPVSRRYLKSIQNMQMQIAKENKNGNI